VIFWQFFAAKEPVAMKWIEIGEGYLQTGTAVGSHAFHEH